MPLLYAKIGFPEFPDEFPPTKNPLGWRGILARRRVATLRLDQVCQAARPHADEQRSKKTLGVFAVVLGDEKLPRYIGIIVRYSKPLLYVFRIPMNQSGFHGSCQSRVLLPLLSC